MQKHAQKEVNELNPQNTFSLFLENHASSPSIVNLFNLGQPPSFAASIHTQSIILNVDFSAILNLDNITVNGSQTAVFQQLNTNTISFVLTNGSNLSTALINGFNQSLFAQTNFCVLQVIAGNNATSRTLIITQPQIVNNWKDFTIVTVFTSNFSTTILSSEYFNGTQVEVRAQTQGLTYSDILNSQIAHAYRPLAINIFSANQTQVLNTVAVTHENANGDKQGFSYVPTIDPYAKQAYVRDSPMPLVILNGRTNMAYEIEGNTTLRLDFLYIYDAPARLFEHGISARIRDEYNRLSEQIKGSQGRLVTLVMAN